MVSGLEEIEFDSGLEERMFLLFIYGYREDGEKNVRGSKIVIVVIDFGIMYMGYVYIFKVEFDKVKKFDDFCNVLYK